MEIEEVASSERFCAVTLLWVGVGTGSLFGDQEARIGGGRSHSRRGQHCCYFAACLSPKKIISAFAFFWTTSSKHTTTQPSYV